MKTILILKYIRSCIYAFGMLFCLTIANGAEANSPFSVAKVHRVILHDSGTHIILLVDSVLSHQEGCTYNNYLILLESHPLFDQMYSAALSAFHAETEITGWVDGCHSWSAPILTRLELIK